MTKATTKVFDEAAGRAERRPRFLLAFDAAVTPIQLSSFEDLNRPGLWPLLQEVSGFSGKIQPNEGSADVAGISVKIVDDERFHQLAALLPDNCYIQVKGGYATLLEADWSVLITGLLEELELDSSLGLWTMKINDLNYYKINSAFRTVGKTHLNGAFNAGAAVCNVDSTNGATTGDQTFHDPAASETNGWFLVGEEIHLYSGLTPTSFTGCAHAQLPQCGGGADANHNDRAEVRELFVLTGNPIDLLLKLLTSTGTGVNGAYDVWETDQGLGIDVSLIDVTKFEDERDRFLVSDIYRFVLKQPISSVKEFTEKEIFRTVNAYPIISGAGVLSVRLYNMPFAYDPEPLAESDLISVERWDRGLTKIVNQCQFSYDYNIVKGEFMTFRYDLEAPSINKHGLAKPWKCEAKGLYTDLGADGVCDLRVTRVFVRYSDGCPGFTCEADMGKFKIDPGDIVSVTHSRLPNQQTGCRGLDSAWMEVVGSSPDPARGSIKFEVLHTGFAGKAGMITPDSFPTYALATAEQRNWGYICETATELMPNGDPPSLIV